MNSLLSVLNDVSGANLRLLWGSERNDEGEAIEEDRLARLGFCTFFALADWLLFEGIDLNAILYSQLSSSDSWYIIQLRK
jgi:hypothetical protein